MAFVRSLWQRRALLLSLTWRLIQTENRGTFLGFFWYVLQPLLTFSVYGFVFVLMFRGRFGEIPNETSAEYAIGMFLGLNLIQLFLDVFINSPRVIIQNPNFVKKIVFPLEILPIVRVGAALFRTFIGIGLVFIALCIGGPLPNALSFWMIPILIIILLWTMGIAWMISALGVFIRDLELFTQFLSLMITFLSAVFYSPDRFTGVLAILRINPLLICIEASRDVLLWHRLPHIEALLICGIVGILFCILAHAFFMNVKGAFADYL